MADFCKWGMAVALGQGRDPEQFLKDFAVNVERQNDEALAASDVATVLLAFMADINEWSGQPYELFATLKDRADNMRIPVKSFPGNAAALGRRLREIRPNLAALGHSIEFKDSARPRLIHITRLSKKNADGADAADGQQDSTVSTDGIFPIVTAVDPWDGGGVA
jgi:hypothetical protein